jgi:hypothetical protein
MELVKQGQINLCNAFYLSKLPATEHEDYMAQAKTMEPLKFSAVVFRRYKEVRDAKRSKRT